MRYAVLSDIHGNSIALDAVLAALASHRIDGYLVLGDLCGIGYDPVGVLERLHRLPNLLTVRGNADRYVTRGQRPFPRLADVQADLSLLPKFQEIERSFGWTQGAIQAAGWFDWLDALPLEIRLTLPDGTRLLGVHAAPGRDSGQGFVPTADADTLRELVANAAADLVLVGHTHWQWRYEIDDVTVVNVGCVSNPRPPDNRASFAVLDADAHETRITCYRLRYDTQAAIRAAYAVRYPAADFVSMLYAGEDEAQYTEDPIYPHFTALP